MHQEEWGDMGGPCIEAVKCHTSITYHPKTGNQFTEIQMKQGAFHLVRPSFDLLFFITHLNLKGECYDLLE